MARIRLITLLTHEFGRCSPAWNKLSLRRQQRSDFHRTRQQLYLDYMNTRSSKLVRFLSVLLCLVVWVVGPRAVAQTPAELDIQLYAGLTITGAVGTVYQIQ